MQARELGQTLIVKTGVPATSIVLLICALATAMAASIGVFGSEGSLAELWWAVFVVIFLLIAAWLFGEVSEFVFSKSDNRFSWSYRRLFVRRGGHMPLAMVIKARRDVLQDSEGNAYRLLIETSNGRIPLTRSFGGNELDMSRIADHIQRFMTSGRDAADTSR